MSGSKIYQKNFFFFENDYRPFFAYENFCQDQSSVEEKYFFGLIEELTIFMTGYFVYKIWAKNFIPRLRTERSQFEICAGRPRLFSGFFFVQILTPKKIKKTCELQYYPNSGLKIRFTRSKWGYLKHGALYLRISDFEGFFAYILDWLFRGGKKSDRDK